jgi:hypothetical protein
MARTLPREGFHSPKPLCELAGQAGGMGRMPSMEMTMGLNRFLGDISVAMAMAFADDEPWSSRHVATDEHVDVQAFLKWISREQDPCDKPTKRQKVPIVQPWASRGRMTSSALRNDSR